MGEKLTRVKIRKIFPKISTARVISLRIIGSLIAMALLVWTIRYGYEAATETRRQSLHSQWVSRIGALIMLFGFLLMALGLPIIADLFLRLSEELQDPDETGIPQGSNPKVDISV